ncbi:MAG: LytR C-terminal domain-containing protein, partial [Calditrichaeota bacterium]|nr:LytR C-terminal domain-containing protein [Calditrichota bacterium]
FREFLNLSGSASRNSSTGQTRSHPSDSDGAARPAENDGAITSQDSATVPVPRTVARRIQVEVLNGCGVDGLAEQITNYLREKNIDVVSRGNYTHFDVPLTTVLDRVDNRERSLQIINVLGLPEKQLQLQKDSNLQLDATIVLGADYKKLIPFK